MSHKLPVISGKKLCKFFEGLGYIFEGQAGSHMFVRNSKTGLKLSIPNHTELNKGTLMGIVKTAGMTRKEFLKLYK